MDTPEDSAAHKAELSRLEAMRALPVEPYLGLTVPDAEERATSEGRQLRVLLSLTGPRRTDLRYDRLNVTLDAAGIVTAADIG